jgi:LPXTG-site transpeptidase (sortase) family protein
MDRRSFITLLATGILGVGCQTSSPSVRRLAPEESPRLAPTLAFPKPATVAPTAGPLEQERIIPIPTAAPRTFSTRTLPPERLIIPAIGVDSKVVPLGTTIGKTGSTVWETAAFAVGHHRGSSNPGEPGNLVLSGHISSPGQGAVFNKLPKLEIGNGVIVVTPQQHYMYIVRDIQTVRPTAVEFLNPTANSIATLITCVPDGVYTHRLVVRCDAV